MARLRKLGIHAMVICSSSFMALARSQARINGVPDLHIIEIEHPLGGLDEASVRKRFEAALPQVLAAIPARAVP